MISDFSSIRSSTDNLLNPGSRDADKLEQDEPSLWHSLPLVFAILPAVSGIFFTNGSAVVTDILLLGLASLLLNWCVRMPWYVLPKNVFEIFSLIGKTGIGIAPPKRLRRMPKLLGYACLTLYRRKIPKMTRPSRMRPRPTQKLPRSIATSLPTRPPRDGRRNMSLP